MNTRTTLLLLLSALFLIHIYIIYTSYNYIEKFRMNIQNKNNKNQNNKTNAISLLDDPAERKTVNFLQKYIFYTPYLMYYPMTISTLSRENNDVYKQNYKALYNDMSSNVWSDPLMK